MGDADLSQGESEDHSEENTFWEEGTNEDAAEPIRQSKTRGSSKRASQESSGSKEQEKAGTSPPAMSNPEDDPSKKRPEKGVQVPYVDSWAEGPNDKSIQVIDGRSSIRPNDKNIQVGSRESQARSPSISQARESQERSPSISQARESQERSPSISQARASQERSPSISQAKESFEGESGQPFGLPDKSDDECVCTCESHLDYKKFHSFPGESEGGEDFPNIDNKLFVGALKVTSKAVTFTIFNIPNFEPLYTETEKISTSSPEPGHYEQNSSDIITLAYQVINRATYKCNKQDSDCLKNLKAIGITNQSDTIVAWDSETSEPLAPVILGKDTRGAALWNEIVEECGGNQCLMKETGMRFSKYAAPLKIRWLLDNVSEVADAQKKGTLRVGTLDSWMVWNLTQGNLHITDYTNAARTMLMNIEKCEWDASLLSKFGLDATILPHIVSSSEQYGEITNENCSLKGVHIAGIICVPNSVMIGTCSVENGNAIVFSESQCSHIMINSGKNLVISDKNLNSTVAYKIGPSSTPVYAMEEVVSGFSRENRSSSVFKVMSASFFRRTLDDDAIEVRDTELARTAGQTDLVMKAAQDETGEKVEKLYIVGDTANIEMFMQMQANISNIPVYKPYVEDAPSRGAAILAAHGESLYVMTNNALQDLTRQDVKYVRDENYTEPPADADDANRDPNERDESPPFTKTSTGGRESSSTRQSGISNQPRASGEGGSGSGGGGGDRGGGGFPIKLEDIDLQTALILLLIALALMYLGHLIGRAFSSPPPPPPTIIRKCPKRM